MENINELLIESFAKGITEGISEYKSKLLSQSEILEACKRKKAKKKEQSIMQESEEIELEDNILDALIKQAAEEL